MSYTIYFQTHEKGEDQQISTEKIADCFEPFISKRDEFGFEVKYDEMNSSFIFIDIDKETCSHFSVDRPCRDDRLFKALFDVSKLGNLICLFPEGNAQVFNDKTIENLPADMKLAFDEGQITYETISTLEDYLNKINRI